MDTIMEYNNAVADLADEMRSTDMTSREYEFRRRAVANAFGKSFDETSRDCQKTVEELNDFDRFLADNARQIG